MWIDKLAQFKKASKKTTRQISVESGIPIGTLNKLFAGQTQDPKLETVRAVVHTLGYTLDELLEESSSTVSKGTLTEQELSRLSDAISQLNEEGCERVVEYAEDLVAGGRYKKINQHSMGKEA